MVELHELTHEHFDGMLGQRFDVHPEGVEPLSLELIEVTPRGNPDPQRETRRAFSLLLRGPLEPVLGQGSWPITNDALGALVWFLVPLGPGREGMLYDVTFG